MYNYTDALFEDTNFDEDDFMIEVRNMLAKNPEFKHNFEYLSNYKFNNSTPLRGINFPDSGFTYASAYHTSIELVEAILKDSGVVFNITQENIRAAARYCLNIMLFTMLLDKFAAEELDMSAQHYKLNFLPDEYHTHVSGDIISHPIRPAMLKPFTSGNLIYLIACRPAEDSAYEYPSSVVFELQLKPVINDFATISKLDLSDVFNISLDSFCSIYDWQYDGDKDNEFAKANATLQDYFKNGISFGTVTFSTLKKMIIDKVGNMLNEIYSDASVIKATAPEFSFDF